MKKFFALLLAAVMCLALVACGKPQPTATGTVVIHITINPEFKLHLDSVGNVVQVDTLNGDAQVVSDAIQLTGMSCETAITALLNETIRQGFLCNGGDITVTVEISDNISNQLDKWQKTVMDGVAQALSTTNTNASISFSAEIMHTPNTPPQNDPAGQGTQTGQETPTIDANGNSITIDADGNTRVESPNGSVSVLRPDGTPVLLIFTEADGTRVTQQHDSNSVIIQESFEYPDGSQLTRFFYSSGTLMREVHTDRNGTETVQEYDNSGHLIPEGTKVDANGVYYYPDYAGQSRVFVDEMGESWNNTYDAQGYLVESYREWTDSMGFVWRDYMEQRHDGTFGAVTYHFWNGNWEPKVMYHPNGVVSKEVLGQSGHGLSVGYYDINGMLTDVYGWDNFNLFNHLVYSADGSYACHTTNADGSVSTFYYDANGNEIHP